MSSRVVVGEFDAKSNKIIRKIHEILARQSRIDTIKIRPIVLSIRVILSYYPARNIILTLCHSVVNVLMKESFSVYLACVIILLFSCTSHTRLIHWLNPATTHFVIVFYVTKITSYSLFFLTKEIFTYNLRKRNHNRLLTIKQGRLC